jgi:hypothetical protein
MIRMMQDQIFLGAKGESLIPCSVEQITVELSGTAIGHLPQEMLHEATAAVMHYFREELGQTHVTPEAFSKALARVLEGLGVPVEVTDILSESSPDTPLPVHPVSQTSLAHLEKVHALADLGLIVSEAGKMGELAFFPKLQEVLQQGLEQNEGCTLELRGLRQAVKQLLGRKHWSASCQELEERIVETLRTWWVGEIRSHGKALLVR